MAICEFMTLDVVSLLHVSATYWGHPPWRWPQQVAETCRRLTTSSVI